MKRIIFLLVLFVLICSNTFAEIIRLKDSRREWYLVQGEFDIFKQGVSVWNKYMNAPKYGEQKEIINYVKIQNENLDGLIMRKVYLLEFYIISSSFKKSDFHKANIYSFHYSIQNSDFRFSNFNDATIGMKIKKCNFSNSNFTKALIYTDGFRHIISNCYFQKCNFTKAFFYFPVYDNVNFSGSIFQETEFRGACNISNFKSCDFTNAHFKKLKIGTKIKFELCNFTNVDFSGAVALNNALFINCDFNGAKIERKWFDHLKKQGVRNFDKIQWM